MDRYERLKTRSYILSNLEKIIDDSIYYRSNNRYMNTSTCVKIGPVGEKLLEAKLNDNTTGQRKVS